MQARDEVKKILSLDVFFFSAPIRNLPTPPVDPSSHFDQIVLFPKTHYRLLRGSSRPCHWHSEDSAKLPVQAQSPHRSDSRLPHNLPLRRASQQKLTNQ